MTITCPIAAALRSYPDRPAVVAGGSSLSYLELNGRIDTAVGALTQRGVGPGTHVGIRMHAGGDFAAVLWALLRMRSVAVLLSDREPDERVSKDSQATGCRLLVSDGPTSTDAPVASPREILGGYPSQIDGGSRDLALDSPATIMFTSGSESKPKAVAHSLANHWFSAKGSQSVMPVNTDTRWAVVIPAHHVGGLSIFFRCFLHGGTVVVPDREHRDPAGLASQNVTHVSVVPTQLIDWLNGSDGESLLALDTILVGGGPTPARFRQEAINAGLPVRFTYGSTEMASQIATTAIGEKHGSAGFAGRILPHREVRIQDGEIWVRGETRFLGYWLDGRLVTPFDGEGWFATGDAGLVEADRLIVTGRLDNRFISGGENIYPEEIEEAITTSGLADTAIVVPVEDERFGARPIAYIRPPCSLETLREGLGRHLPAYKIPDRVFPLPDEMNGSKGDRRKLAANAPRTTSD